MGAEGTGVSDITVRPEAGAARGAAAVQRVGRRLIPRTPASVVITAATVLGLGLRLYQLARPGHLLGATEYDDGADFGGALRLVSGAIPYRDFVTVQPPGIILLMLPAALLSKLTGAAWAMAAARILTALAGAASVLLGGLAGAVAVFDGDQLAAGRRLAWGGAALGFAGAIKVWAIIPVAVILALSLPRPRRAALFMAGVAAGFCVPVLPFAAAAPRGLFDGVIAAALLAGAFAAGWLVTRRGPPALDWFAIAATVLVVAAFLLPDDFYYHYAGFLAPFLALSLGLSAARVLGDPLVDRLRRPDRLRWAAAGLAGLVIVALPLAVPWAENAPTPVYPTAAAARVIPPRSCVLTDQASLLIAADRFASDVPGCSLMVDATGTDYVLGRGRNGLTAGRVPAVAAVWRQALGTAQYVWLTPYNAVRIAWTPALEAYFNSHFVLVQGPWAPLSLYARKGLRQH